MTNVTYLEDRQDHRAPHCHTQERKALKENEAIPKGGSLSCSYTVYITNMTEGQEPLKCLLFTAYPPQIVKAS